MKNNSERNLVKVRLDLNLFCIDLNRILYYLITIQNNFINKAHIIKKTDKTKL